MDNFKFNVLNSGKENFEKTMALGLLLSGSKTKYYGISEEKGMALFWSDPNIPGVIELPYPMDNQQIISFVSGWLQTAKYPSQPDHDGDNERGWFIYNESWGHVWNNPYGILGIQPVWAIYGK